MLEKSKYSVVAELGKADLKETKGKLEKGQVLPLLNEDGHATISINGTPALRGPTGESSGHYSVQVIRGAGDKKPSAIKSEQKRRRQKLINKLNQKQEELYNYSSLSKKMYNRRKNS